MSIIDHNDLIFLCENQFWVRARMIINTELIGFDIQFLIIFDDKPEMYLDQKILTRCARQKPARCSVKFFLSLL